MTSRDCAIFFDENAYSINVDRLMGRNSAGASFLKGYFLHGTPENFWVYTNTENKAKMFVDFLCLNSSRKDAQYIPWKGVAGLKSPGNLFYPGPDFIKLAWQRRLFGENSWSICGITHTTSSATVMDSIGEYYTAPIKSWDALICTSESVKKNVEYILERKKIYLMDELGLSNFVSPRLPVIPLGINTKEFEFTDDQRKDARHTFNIESEAFVIAYIGRLSFHAKANPIAMYSAVEKVARLNPAKKIYILQCGWFANDWIKTAFRELSDKILTDVNLINIDGKEQKNVKMVWKAADVFCSFSDNIQETFGISPLEAMAAGLPVVVSDWNGYKESVRDEVDGFKISTVIPDGAVGNDLAIAHALEIDNYDHYIGKSSAFVAVDIEQAADRFDRLIKSYDLRKKMGINAKKRAREVYDWKEIIPQYEELWSSLGEERARFSYHSVSKQVWPERPDPFLSFGHYASCKKTERSKLELVYKDLNETLNLLETFKSLKMSAFIHSMLPTDDEFRIVFKSLEHGSLQIQDILENFTELRRPIIYRSLFWLLKIGLVKLSS